MSTTPPQATRPSAPESGSKIKASKAASAAAEPAPEAKKPAVDMPAKAAPASPAAKTPSETAPAAKEPARAAAKNAAQAPAAKVEPSAPAIEKPAAATATPQSSARKPAAAEKSTEPAGAAPEPAEDVASGAKAKSVESDPGSEFGAPGHQLSDINETVLAFVRRESDAALAHFQALSQVKSPTELARLQVGEFQRAAGASFACLTEIARSIGRLGGSSKGR